MRSNPRSTSGYRDLYEIESPGSSFSKTEVMERNLRYVYFVCCAMTTQIATTTEDERNVTYVYSEKVNEIANAYRNITALSEKHIEQTSPKAKRGRGFFQKVKLLGYCAAALEDHLKGLLTRTTTFEHFFIFPGTKWCGRGNRSVHENDLGPLQGTDRCCRDHDRGAEFIEPLSKKYGIVNKSLWPMMNCQDDQKFYDCLLNDNSPSRMMSACVGTIYFDIMGARCFKKGYAVTCVEPVRRLLHATTCRRFQVDTSTPTWQLSPSKDFLDAYLLKT